MRCAIISDIHGNITAFEAVVADLKQMAPDMVFHGGDLADGGADPVAIIDHIRDAGWRGVLGNTDEMLFRPASLTTFAAGLPGLASLFDKIAEMAGWTADQLGGDRLAWLSGLPEIERTEALALLHASPGNLWSAPRPDAEDATLRATYGGLDRPTIVYGHIHLPFVRSLGDVMLCNGGSVGQPHDGDPRASYLLIDDGRPLIRRVDYDLDREIARLRDSKLPYADWVVRMISHARPELP
ncbi:MAG: metallophosphoesterase family protein [Azospirillaceae bacterium]|nr:metallophosphoesterase family protein [Azospirillaceae bacterium]